MSYKSGDFIGVVKDYGIGETKAGDPQVVITFTVDFGDAGQHDMNWYGTLKEGKGRDITLKALLAVGFHGEVAGLLDPDGGAIAKGTQARLVIAEEARQDGNGTVHRIKWVNSMSGGGGGIKRADPSAARAKLAKLNIEGDLAKLRAQTGQEDTPF
jgi:hypothetical protein